MSTYFSAKMDIQVNSSGKVVFPALCLELGSNSTHTTGILTAKLCFRNCNYKNCMGYWK